MEKSTDFRVIDFHSHILPLVDHGSDSLETSLSQLALMKKVGTDIAVATPHFYPHENTVDEFLARREKGVEELAAAKDDGIKLAVGAEVYCVAELEKLEGLEKLTIKGTNTLLLEMPLFFWNNNLFNTVAQLDDRFDLVLAHIDRYPSSGVERLLDMGIRAQINAENVLRKANRPRLEEWRDSGVIWAIGSDLHGADKITLQEFSKLQKVLKYDIEDIFARTEELIKGAELI